MPARPYLLAGGAFAVGSSAYVISGLLPAIASGLGVSLTAAGQLATVFSLTYAVAAPLQAILTKHWDRRTLLVVALLLVGAGSALSAASPNYAVVLVGRVVAAVGGAAYTPAATLVATQLLGAGRRGRAVALVFGGLTVALLIGVPAGSILGGALGYEGVFGLVALVSVLAAVAVQILLPRVDAPPAVGLRARLAEAANRPALTVLMMTVFSVLGTMSVFIYVVPLLTASAGVDHNVAGVLLAVYGVGAVVGNNLGGRVTDRFGSMSVIISTMAGFVVLIALWPLVATTAIGAGVLLFLWSVVTWAFNPPMQHLLIEIGPAGGHLLSLNASAIYLGAGLSGVVGGVVINTLGVLELPLVAAVLGAVSLGLALTLRRRVRNAAPVAPVQAAVPTTV